MPKNLEEQVAVSLDGTAELLPYLPELLSDLWEIGGSPEIVANLLRPLKLQPGCARVLDLGCGKGAIAIRLAKEFGFRVVGVDGMEPFVAEAKRYAAENGVGDLCEFQWGDLRNFLNPEPPFDAVVYAGVSAFDHSGESVKNLREVNLRNTELIRRRAQKLAQKYPRDPQLIFDYVRRQEKETDLLGSALPCAVWLLQRA